MLENSVERESTNQIEGKLIAYLRDELCDPKVGYHLPLTRVKGGNETAIYRFRLTDTRKELNQRLILRLYPEYRTPEDAVWESSIQNVLAEAGYPVAKAYIVCTDKSILGGAFFIMECLPGEPLWTAPIETVPELLGKTHAALHQIDPRFLLERLREQGFDEMGNQYLRQPLFRKDLIKFIHKVTGIWILVSD